MSQAIYEQHDKAFALVGAHVLVKDGQRIGTIAFKFPKDGAGRLWCYFHIIGLEMQRGYAGGYGYDKQSAAVQAAAARINDVERSHAIKLALHDIGGKSWNDALRDAGFQIFSAI